MLVIGLTGGIGSGKTTVLKMFQELGAAIYITDQEAKRLMNSDTYLIRSINALFGEEAYKKNQLDRKFIADKVFLNKRLLEELNAIVHPVVRADFKTFISKSQASYIIYESAILFESGSDAFCNLTISLSAPEDLRIERVVQRDESSVELVKNRMQHQISEETRNLKADFVITNVDLQQTNRSC